MRIPLVFTGPGIPKGVRISEPVSLIDIMPSLNELLGSKYSGEMQGASLLPSMLGEKVTNREVYFCNIVPNEQVDALLRDNVKLISMRDGTFKLYDLAKDLNEAQDVAATMAEKMDSMRQRLLAIRHDNTKRQLSRKESAGFSPKSKEEEREILNQLKSLGYMK